VLACEENQWHVFNDVSQHVLNPERIVTPFAYVLFYKKRFNADEKMPFEWESFIG
jgi:ubiquitin C-terminal hydrolase